MINIPELLLFFLTYLLKPCGNIKINEKQTTVKEWITVDPSLLNLNF